MVGEQQQSQSSSFQQQIHRTPSPNTWLSSSSSSPSSQVIAYERMSLYELRELASRQQERIETTHKLIMNKEQKLKYLKNDHLLNHSISDYDKNLQRLKESVLRQEIKLRQLRSLKGQVQKQRCSNSNLCSELESIRTLFNEKEKELSVALTKVDALTRQLEELRKGNTTNSYHIIGISNGKRSIELEKLRQELLYRNDVSEQHGLELLHKKGLLNQRQSEMVQADKRISELQKRLESVSSRSSLSSLSSQNNAKSETKSMANIGSNSCTTITINNDNNSLLNTNIVLLKNETNNDHNNYSPSKINYSNSVSTINNNNNKNDNNNSNSNNSFSSDWQKAKRRPVIANNEIEQELALQTYVSTEKSVETNQNSISSLSQSQQNDSKNQQSGGSCITDSSLSVEDKQTDRCDSIQTHKSDKSSEQYIDSESNLIKDEQTVVEDEDIGSNNDLVNDHPKDNESEQLDTTDNCQPNQPKCLINIKRNKGNLKCQQLNNKDDHIVNSCPLTVCKRVSFDPLALLLDAALEGELELVKKTANEVPNPSAANDEGITALHNAICAGHFDIVKYLVDNGCDVNAQDSDGWTPLHCAASCNNLSMVKFLVENGACIFATTLSDQETAAEKCEEDEEGFDGCSQYLYGVQEKLGILNGSAVYSVYDYESENSDELSFKEGDLIIVMRKGDEQEREWWWAHIRDREGYVPRNLLGLYPRVKPNKELQTIKEEQCE